MCRRQSRHASITVESSRVRKSNALYEMIHEWMHRLMHNPEVTSSLTSHQHLGQSRKCAGIMETVDVTGGPWWWVSQPRCYFESSKHGGLLRSERRQMPAGLTGWPTSVPSWLFSDQIWYLMLWEGPEVTAALPDFSGHGSCLLVFCFFILWEWGNRRNPKERGQPSGNHCQKFFKWWGKKRTSTYLFLFVWQSGCNFFSLLFFPFPSFLLQMHTYISCDL